MSDVITGPGEYRLEGCDEPAKVRSESTANDRCWNVDLPPAAVPRGRRNVLQREKYESELGDGYWYYYSNGTKFGDVGFPRIVGPWIDPGEGWRLLGREDVLAHGDEYGFSPETHWHGVAALAGQTVGGRIDFEPSFVARRRIEPAPFRPEPGKFYRTRGGKRSKVEFRHPNPAATYPLVGWVEAEERETTWKDDGTFLCGSHSHDLIAEWTEPKPPRVVEVWLYHFPTANGGTAAGLWHERWPESRERFGEAKVRFTDGKLEIVEAEWTASPHT